MAIAAPAFHVQLDRAELVDELIGALAAGDCICTRVDGETVLVVHRDAEDWAEARTELRFFLDAWGARRSHAAARLL